MEIMFVLAFSDASNCLGAATLQRVTFSERAKDVDVASRVMGATTKKGLCTRYIA